MNVMKKYLLLCLLLCCPFLLSGCGKTAAIAYVDPSRIENECESLKKIQTEATEKLRAMQKDLVALQEKRKAGQLTEEEFQKEMNAQQMQMQATAQKYQIEVRQRLEVALESICKEKKLDVVLRNDKDVKLVHLGGTDVTDLLLERLK